MSLITVDSEKCIECDACIDVCPAVILDHDNINGLPQLISENEVFCIDCFHCEAVCPTGAFTHHSNEAVKDTTENVETSVSAEALNVYLKKRRSIRCYKKAKVEQTKLKKALETVSYAPTGINRQLNHWIIVSDDDIIHQLGQATVDWMKSLETIAPEKYAYFSTLVEAWEKGIDRICRGAPHLAFCCGPRDPLGKTDADIATSHLEVVLPSLGLGGCWAGYIMSAFASKPELNRMIGLNNEFTAHGILMLGYPAYEYKEAPSRKPASVSWL